MSYPKVDFFSLNESFIKQRMIEGVTIRNIANELKIPHGTFVTLLDMQKLSPIRVRREHRQANPHLFKHQQYAEWKSYKKTWQKRMPQIIKMIENCVGLEQIAEHYNSSAGTICSALKEYGTSAKKIKEEKAKSYMEGVKNEKKKKVQ